MARRHAIHEEHLNHEAWAIPYGDLVTLLLAFFVVMYAVSSVNEGKYRVMADAMSAAFGGKEHSATHVQVSDAPTARGASGGVPVPVLLPVRTALFDDARTGATQQLNDIGERVEGALADLVAKRVVNVRRGPDFLEIEIQSDLLFASGSALPSAAAVEAIGLLADVLRGEPNDVRVEGYTDDRPIRTAQFPSNWELSAARAASVVHVLAERGLSPSRLAVIGYGQFRPRAANTDDAGRNANRRVQLVVMAAAGAGTALPPSRAAATSAAPAFAGVGAGTAVGVGAHSTAAGAGAYSTAVGVGAHSTAAGGP